MSTLYVWEAANLMVGDQGPDNSKHLILDKIRIPTLEEIVQTHHAGGAIGEIEIGMRSIKALTAPFSLKGVDPQTLSQFGLGSVARQNYTVYQSIRDKVGNAPIQGKAVLFGRLTKADQSEYKRGDFVGADYEIKEILHYELYFNGAEKYYFDWASSIWRVDGVSQNADEVANLAIPAG